MTLLSRVERGRAAKPPRIMVYGAEGIGKSTFGSQAPKPIFVQTRGWARRDRLRKFPLATTFDDVTTALRQLQIQHTDYEIGVTSIR